MVVTMSAAPDEPMVSVSVTVMRAALTSATLVVAQDQFA
jgi:hypothetical protein